MEAVRNPAVVKKQYANADGLNVRMALHQKYSTNKQPFADWIMEHYLIQPGMQVLELGCGNGNMWRNPERHLPKGAQLILTDFSAGMLQEARAAVPARSNISFEQVDIQQIPYKDASFDLVIANMMLYHVPDLDKALSEAARVLKPDGRFICATFGENGLHSWLHSVLGSDEDVCYSFTMQNGRPSLLRHFRHVDDCWREDGLEVTHTDDLADYVLSSISFSGIRNRTRAELIRLLDQQKENGAIRIAKEYGLFQCCEPIVTNNFD